MSSNRKILILAGALVVAVGGGALAYGAAGSAPGKKLNVASASGAGAPKTSPPPPTRSSTPATIMSGFIPSPATLPPQLSGSPGGSASPLAGSPTESLQACARAAGAPSSILYIQVGTAGFAQPCYSAVAGTALAVHLSDEVLNPTSGLTNPMDFTISSLSRPVIGQAAPPPSTPPPPGMHPAVVGSPPVVDMTNALYTSPTASDNTPLAISVPAMAAGQYLLQLPEIETAPAAILTLVPGPVSSTVPAPTGPSTTPRTIAGSSGVSVLSATAADLGAMTTAFDTWENLPSTCPAKITPGTVRVAQVTATGVSWAVANFEPVSSCTYSLLPVDGKGSMIPVPPDQVGPFSEPNLVGVFQELVGGPWTMNSEGGYPYPCPGPSGEAPGPGNGAFPHAVLTAWHMTYASDCARVYFPPRPPSG